MRYVKRVRVRFGHTDPAEIVYYPRYFEWFHDAFEDTFEDVMGEPYAALLERTGVGYPAVQVACEWRHPARFGELVDVEVFLSRLGERSATFEYRVRRDGRLLATASVKVVGMSIATHTPTSFPEAVRQAFQPYLEEDLERPDTGRIR